jgi:hypothetical protein
MGHETHRHHQAVTADFGNHGHARTQP